MSPANATTSTTTMASPALSAVRDCDGVAVPSGSTHPSRTSEGTASGGVHAGADGAVTTVDALGCAVAVSYTAQGAVVGTSSGAAGGGSGTGVSRCSGPAARSTIVAPQSLHENRPGLPGRPQMTQTRSPMGRIIPFGRIPGKLESAPLEDHPGRLAVPRRGGHALLPQLVLEHPPDGIAGKVVAELDIARDREERHPLGDPAAQLLLG